MTTKSLILYVKAGCLWCRIISGIMAINTNWSTSAAIVLHPEELKRISGQTFTPTLARGSLVLRDFGPENLEEFLQAHNIQP
jgi:hypothetical protein